MKLVFSNLNDTELQWNMYKFCQHQLDLLQVFVFLIPPNLTCTKPLWIQWKTFVCLQYNTKFWKTGSFNPRIIPKTKGLEESPFAFNIAQKCKILCDPNLDNDIEHVLHLLHYYNDTIYTTFPSAFPYGIPTWLNLLPLPKTGYILIDLRVMFDSVAILSFKYKKEYDLHFGLDGIFWHSILSSWKCCQPLPVSI